MHPRRLGAALALAALSFAAGCSRSALRDGLPADVDCTGCHGQDGDPTPPVAVDGTSGTENIGVGAHQVHMRGGWLAGPVACSECHILPAEANGTDHPDPLGRPADVVFGALADKESADPFWDRDTRTCAGTYCHGATLRGGDVRPPPVWTRVDGSQLKCDSCHGNPPGDTHPQENDCETCHGDVVSAGGVIKAPALHINGTVEVSL
jgi:predicted CxxxxCH...CXXCH cytochrome family protein